MAVFRIEKNKNYTVMSNHHLRDISLSLKAKGLLSLMLSLPDGWDYTLRGLATINKESIDAIRTAVLELEENGYLIRHQGRDPKGKLATIEYTIYEQPQHSTPSLEKPLLDNPITGNPITEDPILDIPTQLNTKELNTEKQKKDQSIDPVQGLIDETEHCIYLIKENIGYEAICEIWRTEPADEIVELMAEVLLCTKPFIRIAGEDKSASVVKNRFWKINQFHVEYVLERMAANTSQITNIRNYLLTALYRSPESLNAYVRSEVNCRS